MRHEQSAGCTLVERQFGRGAFEALFHPLDVFGRGNALGKGAANAFDGVAHFFADLLVGLNRLRLLVYAFTREFVARLRHAELVGGELSGVHAVHQLFFGGNLLVRLDGVAAEPAVQPLVAGVVKHAEHAALHTRLLRRTGERLELLAGLAAQFQPLHVSMAWRKRGHDLGFGVGIAQGYATIGAIGFEGRRDYGTIGTVTNTAARLCGEAKPGQILISQRVCMRVEDHVATEPAGELTLKGLSRVIPAFNVTGRKTAAN